MSVLNRALEIKQEVIKNRRYIHQNPELGFNLDKTVALVVKELTSYGYTPQIIGNNGVTCVAGSTGKTILLRADMDALPMNEESDLDFKSKENACHSCGHDMHTAILLGVAKLLKENEASLKGRVKFMFQPAEELLSGALNQIEAGILENPKVDSAISFHVMAGLPFSKTGMVCYSENSVTFSGDSLVVEITGKSAHGSKPELGVDAIVIASQIVVALQNIPSREISMSNENIVLVGTINGGTTSNTVADYAKLEISVRATKNSERDFLIHRITEICENIAKAFRGSAKISRVFSAPPLINDEKLVEDFVKYTKEILPENMVFNMGRGGGSEDFAYIAEKVPTCYYSLGAGSVQEGYIYSMHHPKVVFNEEAIPNAVATLTHAALRWLEENN